MNKILLSSFTSLIIIFFVIIGLNQTGQKDEFFNKRKKQQPGPDLRPFEWAYLQRTFPYDNSDPQAIIDALRQLGTMKNEEKLNSAFKQTSQPAWEFAGPINIGGRVVDIEFDPQNPEIVYAAASTGGVFKSTDTGQTWFSIFDGYATLNIGDITVDPQNTNIIYVGTGEPNGGHNNFPGAGMFKSTDAGATWNLIGLENTASIGRIIINPNNPQVLYVAAVGSYFLPNPERGVYKSTDGGNSWEISLFVSDSTGAIDLVMDPNDPNFILAAMWQRVRRPTSSQLFGETSGIYRTTNGGTNWQKLDASNGLPTGNNIGRIGLAMSKSNPDIIYSMYTNGSFYSGMYKTTNKGNSWTNADPNNQVSNGTSSFSWYFGQIRIHPTNPDIIYAMDVAFMRSSDGGNSWPINYGYGGPSHLHVDHHALAFHPQNPNYLINGNDGGINISTDAGVTWSQPAYLPVTQFYEIGLDLQNPHRLYGGTQDNNTIRTMTGNIDDWEAILGGDGFYVIVDPTNPNIIYAEYQYGGFCKSTDGGNSFFPSLNGVNTSEPINWSAPAVMDPNNNNVLYFGTNRLYKTTNGADRWTAISPRLTLFPEGNRLGTLTTIAVAPTNSNFILIGTDDGKVWITTNGGTTWTDRTEGLPFRWVTRVAFDPQNENNIYVTFSGLKWRDPEPRVFKSTNQGADWINISSGLPDAPINAIAIDNNNSNRIYIGNDIGAFVTFDGGNSWNILGDGLPAVSVYDMKIHSANNYLIIGTHGRSMYKLNLNNLTSIKEESIINKYFILEQNYPNPFNPTTIINYQLAMNNYVTLIVYDILGNIVATLVKENQSAGSYNINFDGSKLSSGIYYYTLRVGDPSTNSGQGFVQTKKMILMK